MVGSDSSSFRFHSTAKINERTREKKIFYLILLIGGLLYNSSVFASCGGDGEIECITTTGQALPPLPPPPGNIFGFGGNSDSGGTPGGGSTGASESGSEGESEEDPDTKKNQCLQGELKWFQGCKRQFRRVHRDKALGCMIAVLPPAIAACELVAWDKYEEDIALCERSYEHRKNECEKP